MPQDERRRTPRYPFSAIAEVVDQQEDLRLESKVRDLSSGGCYVETPDPLPPGKNVMVEIYTDNVNRTAPEMRMLFKTGQLGNAGANKFLFDHVGLVEAHHPDANTDREGAAIIRPTMRMVRMRVGVRMRVVVCGVLTGQVRPRRGDASPIIVETVQTQESRG